MSIPDPELLPSQGTDDDDDVGISPLWPLNFLLRHRVVLVVTVVIGLALGVAEALARSPWYEASVSFVANPGTGRAAAGMAGPVGPIDQGDPFDYYSRILSSTVVTDAVLRTKITDGVTVRERVIGDEEAPDGRPGFERDFLTLAGARLDSSNRLRRWDVLAVMTVRVGWTDAQTAADLANAYVAALSDFDKNIRSTAAKKRREFIEAQVKETSGLLTKAEEALRLFREQNRLLTSTERDPFTGRSQGVPPLLELRQEQLQREVNVQAELYVSLKKSFEQARIAELDEGTSLVIIEAAVPPRFRTGQSRRGLVMLMGVVGLIVGLGLAVLFELRSRVDLNSPDGVEFAGHLATIRHEVVRVGARTVRALSAPNSASGHQESKHDV